MSGRHGGYKHQSQAWSKAQDSGKPQPTTAALENKGRGIDAPHQAALSGV